MTVIQRFMKHKVMRKYSNQLARNLKLLFFSPQMFLDRRSFLASISADERPEWRFKRCSSVETSREGIRVGERETVSSCLSLSDPSFIPLKVSLCLCLCLAAHTHIHSVSVHWPAATHGPHDQRSIVNSASPCAHFARNLAGVCLDAIFTSWCFAGCQFPCGRAGLVYSCDPHEHCLCATFTTSPGLQLSQTDQGAFARNYRVFIRNHKGCHIELQSKIQHDPLYPLLFMLRVLEP